MIKAIDLRKGKTVMYEEKLYVVHDASHVAKGNKRSYMQVKLKDISGGSILDVRFTVDARVETPYMEGKDYEFLYQDGSGYVFMDTDSYEQFPVPADTVGEAANFLKPNERVKCLLYDGKIITLELPIVVELEVTETSPVVKGATVTNQSKDAILETGAKVRVPPFIDTGEKIRVDTRTGEYIERVK